MACSEVNCHTQNVFTSTASFIIWLDLLGVCVCVCGVKRTAALRFI